MLWDVAQPFHSPDGEAGLSPSAEEQLGKNLAADTSPCSCRLLSFKIYSYGEMGECAERWTSAAAVPLDFLVQQVNPRPMAQVPAPFSGGARQTETFFKNVNPFHRASVTR